MSNVFAIIIGAAVLTFLIRYLPLAILHKRRLSMLVEKFLYYTPLGVLAALATQSVFWKEGHLYSGLPNFYLLGAIVSVALGVATRKLGIVVIGGIGTVALATFIARLHV